MKSPVYRVTAYAICAVIVVSVLTYLNYRLSVASPGGVDFLTHWVGTQALFHGESPYSNEVAVRVQNAVYGRSAQAGENEFLDCYFLYMELVFAPFALISDYFLARAAWMTFLELSSVVIFVTSMRILGWKPKVPTFVLYLLYGTLGYETIRPVINGNVTAVVVLMIVGAVWAIKREKDATAGFLLALALAKPNVTIIPLVSILVWSISVKRWWLLGGFVGSTLVLTIAGMAIIPDWPLQNLSNILRYTSYNPPSTLAAALDYYLPGLGRWIGLAMALLLSTVLAWAWKSSFCASFEGFLPVFLLTLVAAQWLWISTDPGNFIILTLPTAQVLKWLEERPHGPVWSAAFLASLLCGLWALFLATVDRSNNNLQSPIMFIPLPLVLLIGLALSQTRTRLARLRTQAAR